MAELGSLRNIKMGDLNPIRFVDRCRMPPSIIVDQWKPWSACTRYTVKTGKYVSIVDVQDNLIAHAFLSGHAPLNGSPEAEQIIFQTLTLVGNHRD